MGYPEMKQALMAEFNQNRDLFLRYIQAKVSNPMQAKQLMRSKQYTISKTINLVVEYPGFKTKQSYDKIAYDYVVLKDGAAVRHDAIATDLFAKLRATWSPQGPTENHQKRYAYYRRFLADLAQYGTDINVATYQQAIGAVGGYSLQELSLIIPWIALQEDINYPMPRYEGRKMPFMRYMEVLYAAFNNAAALVKEIIDTRINLRGGQRPQPLSFVNYGDVIPKLNQ